MSKDNIEQKQHLIDLMNMEKQKTPLVQAIENIKKSGWLDTQSKIVVVGILSELLPTEKEAFENVYLDGCLENIDVTKPIEYGAYFDSKFNQS